MEFYTCLTVLIGLLNILSLKEAAAVSCSARYSYGFYYTVDCSTSCCGYYYSRYCCVEYEINYGAIVGGIIAFIIFVVVVVIIIIVIKKHQRNRVVMTTMPAQPAVTVVNTSNQQQAGGYGYGQPQPGYGQPYPGYGQPVY